MVGSLQIVSTIIIITIAHPLVPWWLNLLKDFKTMYVFIYHNFGPQLISLNYLLSFNILSTLHFETRLFLEGTTVSYITNQQILPQILHYTIILRCLCISHSGTPGDPGSLIGVCLVKGHKRKLLGLPLRSQKSLIGKRCLQGSQMIYNSPYIFQVMGIRRRH